MHSQSAFTILSLALTVQAHSISLLGAPELNINKIIRARGAANAVSHSLDPRDTLCGNSTGISCPAGQCCGANGYCGSGPSFCNAPDCQFVYGPACDANTTPKGRDTSSVPRPQLGSVQYGGVTITNCVTPGTVAMTYDDGPGPYTSELLDILDKSNVKATFFITGNNNGKGEIDDPSKPWPAIIKRMYSEGHQIASHSWSHPSFDSITSAQRKTELIKNEIAFTNILGFFPTYMRPPFTYCQASTGCTSDIAALGYHIVTFMIDPKDYLNDSPSLIQNSINIFDAAFAGANPSTQEYLPYAHDIHEQSVLTLTPHIINAVQSKGFKMVTVGQCLNDPVENWYRNPNTGGPVTAVQALAANAPASTSSAPASSTTTSVITTSSTSTSYTTTAVPQTSSSTTVLTSYAGTSSHASVSSTSATTSHSVVTTTSRSVASTTSSQGATVSASTEPNVATRLGGAPIAFGGISLWLAMIAL